MRILIAEDDDNVRSSLQEILVQAGYLVTAVCDGEEALRAYNKQDFSLIVTDWMMPKLDGIELIRRVRKINKTSPPIILLTAISSPEARSHVLTCGANDFLPKPCMPENLLACIKHNIRHGGVLLRPRKVNRYPRLHSLPPFVGVSIVSSMGGPYTIREIFRNLPLLPNAAFFIILKNPAWLAKSFTNQIQRDTNMEVVVTEDQMPLEAGKIYVSTQQELFLINSTSFRFYPTSHALASTDSSTLRPFFKSMADAFNRYCISVELTGLNEEPIKGTQIIDTTSGVTLSLNPKNPAAQTSSTQGIARAIAKHVSELSGGLNVRLKAVPVIQ